MNELKSSIDKANQWIHQSVTLKLIIVSILTLMLLIPASMVSSIIHERERLHQETVYEVSRDWAQSQLITGPILTVPIKYHHGSERFLHLLPETLNVQGNIFPETLKRGIYDIVVYKSQLKLHGNFRPHIDIDTAKVYHIAWEQAFVTLGISDLRGIQDELKLQWQTHPLSFKPGSRIPEIIASGITTPVPIDPHKPVPFSLELNLQGSHNLSFIPVGNTTKVDLDSEWASPSFQGNFLPDHRQVSDTGFQAHWKVLQLNRNYPGSWLGNEQSANLHESAFGVDLMLPLDNYQKNIRTAKYAIMVITLTFLAFFLVEILNGKRIHPFQYTLVGLALCLFYILLLSLSEHANFEMAYVMASLGIVVMITLYSVALFKSARLTLCLTATLSSIYGFMFVILQLSDYALLIGSLGLFVILATTMYLTRNVNWYKVQVPKASH